MNVRSFSTTALLPLSDLFGALISNGVAVQSSPTDRNTSFFEFTELDGNSQICSNKTRLQPFIKSLAGLDGLYHQDVKHSRPLTEAEILSEVIEPGRRDLTPEAAKSILSLKFNRTATTRIRSLLRENNRGTISPEGRIELEKYLRVGQLLDLLQAKARLTVEARKAA